MTIIYGDTVAETGVGVYPHAFMKKMVGEMIEVYFRTKFVCSYPMNDVIKSNLTNVILNNKTRTEFYIKDGKVFKYSHINKDTELVLDKVA